MNENLVPVILSNPSSDPDLILITVTSPGRKFALLEGLSHDLKSVPDRFIMSCPFCVAGVARSIITPF